MRESEEATVLTSVGGEGEGGITLEKGREGYANEHADRYANELAPISRLFFREILHSFYLRNTNELSLPGTGGVSASDI